MKVVTVVGARPQFVKAAAVSPLLRKRHREVLVHTGQHYDYLMSQRFFEELHLPEPDYNLEIGSGTHGAQTGRMLEAIEGVLFREEPDCVLVYGDTNSTLAGALAAVKLDIPVAHVEAGLRAHNLAIPEEVNRVVTDHVGTLLLAPTEIAMRNLASEGLADRSVWTGDVMADILLRVREGLPARPALLEKLGVVDRPYVLLTLHRPSNVDDPARLRALLQALARLDYPVVFPVHPRTRRRLLEFGLEEIAGRPPFIICDPLGYVEMIAAESFAYRIVTDSGGVQKEAYLLGVPCVTLRAETEWVETVETGWNQLIGNELERLPSALTQAPPAERPDLFGGGKAAERVVQALEQRLGP